MDIEEGEIIISDVSSDEDKEHQPQPSNKDKFQVQLDTYRYNYSKSSIVSSTDRFKDLHFCHEDSFCRKTFSWRNCLAKDFSGKTKSRNQPLRDETYCKELRRPKHRNILNLKHDNYLDHSYSSQRHRLKKRKRKGKSETFHSTKNKPERSHRNVVNHCENHSDVVDQTHTETHENTSLMQKLITSGLAKPPATASAPIEINLSGSESETYLKKENTSSATDNIESKDYSDDSEIEVFIPPKKIPPLVTLDSDGEEMEELVQNSTANAECSSNTLNDLRDPALSDVTNKLTDVSNNLTLNENETNKKSFEPSTKSLPINRLSDLNIDNSDSSSELGDCISLSYSPSSPSTVSGSENNFTSMLNCQSPVANRNNTQYGHVFGNSFCKDYSSASNEDISSEIWLDPNEFETFENLETSNPNNVQTFGHKQSVDKEYVDLNCIDSEHSLSVLDKNIIVKSTTNENSIQRNLKEPICESFLPGDSNNTTLQTDEDITKDDQQPYSPSSEYNYKHINASNCDTPKSNTEFSDSISSNQNQLPNAGEPSCNAIRHIHNWKKTKFLHSFYNQNALSVLEENISINPATIAKENSIQGNPNKPKCDSLLPGDSNNTNLQTDEDITKDDQEPYSPSSEYSYNHINSNNCDTPTSNTELSDSILSNQNPLLNAGKPSCNAITHIHHLEPTPSLDTFTNENVFSVLNENVLLKSTTIAKESNIQRNPNESKCDSPLTGNSNKTNPQTDEDITKDDQEPYSPSSEYSYNPVNANNCCTPTSNTEFSNSILSNENKLLNAGKPSNSNRPTDNWKQTMSLDSNRVIKSNVNNMEESNVSASTNFAVHLESKMKMNTAVSKKDQKSLNQNDHKLPEKNKNTTYNEIDDDVSQLRMIALLTKRKVAHEETKSKSVDKSISQLTYGDHPVKEQNTSEVCNFNDDDDDVLQLRVAALKSAVIKKYGERKKKGLLLKKRKQDSEFSDDIFTSPESNLAVEQENTSPLSPTKSSASVQGEEDMELAESDFGEDVIEEHHASSNEEKSKLMDLVHSDSCNLSGPSVEFYDVPQTQRTHTHSINMSLTVPPQPLPPGVDGDCPEIINKIFTSALPPPPPPPPPLLVFTPMLPPPPPPPCPIQCTQPPLFSNSNNIDVLERSKQNYKKETLRSSTVTNQTFEKEIKTNLSVTSDLNPNDRLADGDKLKKFEDMTMDLRGNLITVPLEDKTVNLSDNLIPVVKDLLKPALKKSSSRKRKRKKNKSAKIMTETKLNMLCITELPGKSTIKSGVDANLTKIIPSDIQSKHEINYKTKPGMNPVNCERISSVVLCNTNLPSDNWTDDDNYKTLVHTWQNQLSGLEPANPSEDDMSKHPIADDINLSDMIVLDEVGMSPEHRSTKNEGNQDYSSPCEEDEDEDTLRIRALTSLPPKPLFKKGKAVTPHHLYSNIEPNYCNNQEISNRGKKEYNQRRVLERPTGNPKEIPRQRKVVSNEASKYRLTRVTNEQRRSVVHGKETLKVVVPTNSPPCTLPLEPTLPVVPRLVINVNKDSDSEEECEWTRKIRIQESNTTLPPGPVVDFELERSIDDLLMRVRYGADHNSTPKKNENVKRCVSKPKSRRVVEDDPLHDTPLKLLTKEKQEEYKRLKAILERKERERQMKKRPSKPTEKSKPLLQHVLISESNKHNQGNSQRSCCSNNDKIELNQHLDERISDSDSSAEMGIFIDKDCSSSLVQDDAGGDYNYVLDGELCLRRVICNSNADQQSLSSDSPKNVRIVKLNTTSKIDVNSKSHLQPQETNNKELDDSGSKHLDMISSTKTKKEVSANSSGNSQENEGNITSCQLEIPKESSLQIFSEDNHPIQEDSHSQSTKDSVSDHYVLDTKDDEPNSSVYKSSSEYEEINETSNNEIVCMPAVSFDSFQVPSKETDRLDHFVNSKDTDNPDKTEPSGNYKTQSERAFTAQCAEFKTHVEANVHSKDIPSLKKKVGAESVERTFSPDASNGSHQSNPEQWSHTELLSERFGLLDDLSEMAESLDVLDSHQKKLEQAAVEISDLRRALRAAEDALHQKILVAKSYERRLHDTHTAVSIRCTNISQLEATLHQTEIPTTAWQLMSKKVRQVKEKLDKVKGGRSIIKCLINNPDFSKEEFTEMHANLLERKSESFGREDVEEIPGYLWLQDPDSFQLEDLLVDGKYRCDNKTDSLNMSETDSANSVSDSQALYLHVNEDNQKKSVQDVGNNNNPSDLTTRKPVSSKEKPCLQTADAPKNESGLDKSDSSRGDLNRSIESVEKPKQQTLLKSGMEGICLYEKLGQRECSNEQTTTENCASKRSISQVSAGCETVAKRPNLVDCDKLSSEIKNCDNVSNITTNSNASLGNSGQNCNRSNTGTSKTSKSKLKYTSILQFKNPSSSVNKSPSGGTILCPYDLTGRCQDKSCKFQHFH